MKAFIASLSRSAAGSIGGTQRRRRAGWRNLWIAALALALSLAPAAPCPARAQDRPSTSKGTTVLVIPSTSKPRPAETQAKGEYVLDRGLDGRAGRRLYQQAGESMTGYEAVLTLLSTGRRDDAMEALYAFETAFMEGREPMEIERLFEIEVEVIRSLGRRDVESLVPVLVLHHDAYPMYVQRRTPMLAGHASRIAASLADLYAREGGTEGSRILGARALASLGIFAQQSGVKLQGLGLMLHALEFDPTNEAALLGIATVHERSGNYHRAAERLLELLKVQPKHREGRLRMAVNLDRLGSPDQARRLLEELIAEPATDWEAAVAYQELARIHRQAGRLDRAESVLWEGLGRYPGDGRIRTQLAFVLDYQRKPQRALSVIQELTDGRVPEEGPTPRRRYGLGPQEAYHDVLAGLDESSSARMSRLARLVNGSAGDRPAGMP
jgi:tetratricopeptide (TPR) repeat protein